tara:strand:+ start:196 stop:408 length:213 start_codon:yes stop_codon:yes gene_type:complete
LSFQPQLGQGVTYFSSGRLKNVKGNKDKTGYVDKCGATKYYLRFPGEKRINISNAQNRRIADNIKGAPGR